jgi:hypothetical protein
MAPSMKNGTKNSFLPMIVIHRFERSCGPFKGGGGKSLVLSMTLD